MYENLDVVDENNRIVGSETGEKIHNDGLWHRGVHALFSNSKDHLVLQMRSTQKDKFPGHFDLSVFEHLRKGETYGEAAVRGLEEELRGVDVRPEKVLRFKMNYGLNDKMISEVYECPYIGPVRVDRRETGSLMISSLNEIRGMLSKCEDMFAPWTKEILRWYLGLSSKVEVLSEGESGDI